MSTPTSSVRTSVVSLEAGPTLFYREHGDEDGEPIVLLHGYTDSSFSFSLLQPLLDPNRYRTLALDQRGHGDSERPVAGYSMDELAADVERFLDARGIARATVVGHSMGSLVARRFAATRPERIDRLVLIGSSFTFLNELTVELGAVVSELTDPVPESFARQFQESTGFRPLPDGFLDRVVAESLKVPARVWREALQGVFAVHDAEDLATITAPTLVMWGDRDPYFGRDQQDRLVGAIPGARFLVYADTGHNPHWERPESVAYDLAAFLREPAVVPLG